MMRPSFNQVNNQGLPHYPSLERRLMVQAIAESTKPCQKKG